MLPVRGLGTWTVIHVKGGENEAGASEMAGAEASLARGGNRGVLREGGSKAGQAQGAAAPRIDMMGRQMSI